VNPRHLFAYVDFVSDLSLAEVASLLSRELFASVPFEGENTGIWDEVPAVRLSRRPLGLDVELGGASGCDNGFTLQIEQTDFPWERVDHSSTADNHSLDLTDSIAIQMQKLEGITLVEPEY